MVDPCGKEVAVQEHARLVDLILNSRKSISALGGPFMYEKKISRGLN